MPKKQPSTDSAGITEERLAALDNMAQAALAHIADDDRDASIRAALTALTDLTYAVKQQQAAQQAADLAASVAMGFVLADWSLSMGPATALGGKLDGDASYSAAVMAAGRVRVTLTPVE